MAAFSTALRQSTATNRPNGTCRRGEAAIPSVAMDRTIPSAVVSIDEHEAIVGLIDERGGVCSCTVTRGGCPQLRYLDIVVRVIGDPERVAILGTGSMRLALEREYVSIVKRPDRLVDVEPTGRVDSIELLGRLRRLAV
jgi:hypothetical protein